MLTRRRKQIQPNEGMAQPTSSSDRPTLHSRQAQERDGRRAAYIEIVSQYEGRLLRAARHLCGNREDHAQDLVQDALIRGYEAFIQGRFQEGSNVRAWLLRILTNVFLTDYRKRKKREAEVDLDTLTAIGETGPECMFAASMEQPEAALLAATLDEPLEQALAALSPEMRVCVVLVDIEGADYKEAAQALEIPIGTVRSRLARARLQLHALLYRYAQERRMA